jgi:hypothetical protein
MDVVYFPKGPLKDEIAAREHQHLVPWKVNDLQDVDARGARAISSTGSQPRWTCFRRIQVWNDIPPTLPTSNPYCWHGHVPDTIDWGNPFHPCGQESARSANHRDHYGSRGPLKYEIAARERQHLVC